MGMKSEIKAALDAHAAWRDHFKDILHGRAPFDLNKISANDHCVLGKWLKDEGHRMIPSELHDEICTVHQEFHRIAADIIQKIKDKQYTEAHKAISLDGPLNQTSIRLRKLLMQLSFSKPAAENSLSASASASPENDHTEEMLNIPADNMLPPDEAG